MLHVLEKAIKAVPDDIRTMEGRAKLLINTGQYSEARSALDNLLQSDKVGPEGKEIYHGWQAMLDYYQGKHSNALKALESTLRQYPDDLWTISLRAHIYRAMGDDQAALKDEIWIWEQRENPNYQTNKPDFSWAAFRQGMWRESITRIEPFLRSSDTEEKMRAQLLTGLSYLTSGNLERANEFLSPALEACDNPRLITDLVTELEQLRRRVSQEKSQFEDVITSYLDERSGILNRAKSKQNMMKVYKLDSVKEWEKVLSHPVAGKPGSSSWLSAQLGLGRLHLEANHLEAAEKAYQMLLPYSLPEANIGLKKVQERT